MCKQKRILRWSELYNFWLKNWNPQSLCTCYSINDSGKRGTVLSSVYQQWIMESYHFWKVLQLCQEPKVTVRIASVLAGYARMYLNLEVGNTCKINSIRFQVLWTWYWNTFDTILSTFVIDFKLELNNVVSLLYVTVTDTMSSTIANVKNTLWSNDLQLISFVNKQD